MARLHLTFACGDYDRTRALEEGTIRPDGIDLTYLRLPVEETFFRMMRHREFEVAEMSLSSYVLSLRADPAPFVALPVYTSRMFRHGSLYCQRRRRHRRARRTCAARSSARPEYQLTACVWVRGILAGPARRAVRLGRRTSPAARRRPGRIEKAAVDLPESVRIRRRPRTGRSRRCWPRARSTRCAPRGCPALRGRRPAGAAGVPRRRRGREGVLRGDRDLPDHARGRASAGTSTSGTRGWPSRCTRRCCRRKQQAFANLYDTSALRFMLPWLTPQLEEARTCWARTTGPTGSDANRETLATFLRYHHEQGLSRRLWRPEELFAPESTESFVI